MSKFNDLIYNLSQLNHSTAKDTVIHQIHDVKAYLASIAGDDEDAFMNKIKITLSIEQKDAAENSEVENPSFIYDMVFIGYRRTGVNIQYEGSAPYGYELSDIISGHFGDNCFYKKLSPTKMLPLKSEALSHDTVTPFYPVNVIRREGIMIGEWTPTPAEVQKINDGEVSTGEPEIPALGVFIIARAVAAALSDLTEIRCHGFLEESITINSAGKKSLLSL